MEVVERQMTIVNRLGLHARAAGHLRRVAASFKSDIDVIRDNMTANAKSLLGLMALEASKGTVIKVVARGEDAERAVDAIDKLISDRFGEPE